MRSSPADAHRDLAPPLQIGSTAHDRRRPLTTLQCCPQPPLLVDRRRPCSANDRSPAPAHRPGDGNHNSLIASPGSATTLFRSAPHLAVTTATLQPSARGSQIPIAPARRTVLPTPARGFLPRGLSDACPRSAPHCQVTGRHLITLNEGGHFAVLDGIGGFDPSLPFGVLGRLSTTRSYVRVSTTVTVILVFWAIP